MTGDARIQMKDGRRLTVSEYIAYLKEQKKFHAPADVVEASDSWRENMAERTHGENEAAYTED